MDTFFKVKPISRSAWKSNVGDLFDYFGSYAGFNDGYIILRQTELDDLTDCLKTGASVSVDIISKDELEEYIEVLRGKIEIQEDLDTNRGRVDYLEQNPINVKVNLLSEGVKEHFASSAINSDQQHKIAVHAFEKTLNQLGQEYPSCRFTTVYEDGLSETVTADRKGFFPDIICQRFETALGGYIALLLSNI